MRRALALGLVALAAAGCASGGGGAPAARDGSTLATTWRDTDGNGFLSRGPGEPLRNRGTPARIGRTLASLAVLTDVHVRDEESPARVPFLDRLGGPFSSTFRPQETLSAQVLNAAVRSVNAARPDAVLVTGDLIDNAQANELALARTVLDGGEARPDSGAPGYQGVQEASDPDPAYYRPDVDPPRHPGLLDAAQRPFRAPGLSAPWYAVPGNHDLLLAGELARTPSTEAVAVGDQRLVQPDAGLDIPRSENALTPQLVDSVLSGGLPGRTAHIAPDPGRRELTPAQAIAGLRAASGHGGAGPRMDDAFDVGAVRVILLDTVRRDVGSSGVLTRAQVRWLRGQLDAAGDRRVIVVSHQPLTKVQGADAALALLDRDPHVIAALAGDSHHNRIARRGRYWLIQTASLADYPQQARMLRVRETAGGGIVIETWMLDTAPDPLADTARELAYLDAQGGRPQHDAGTPLDRNVRLFMARG
ncbi:MAG TPA: metallophosphoesterase [Solirubrobacteraceae bacterium]|nr:metallophosphoesterase [Solirubrobacteraceae bacterium]